LSETEEDIKTKALASRIKTAEIESYGGAQPAMTVTPTGEARPAGEFDRSKPGVYMNYPAMSAEEDRERAITGEDWARLQDILERDFKVGKEERLEKAQEARIKYQEGMLKVAQDSLRLRERKAEGAQEVDTKYPYVTKAMHSKILDRAAELMEQEVFGPYGDPEYRDMSVAEWIARETEMWNFHMDPASPKPETPELGPGPWAGEYGLAESPELQPEEVVEEQPLTTTPPMDTMQGPPVEEKPGPPVATVRDIPDENLRNQLGNFMGEEKDFQKLIDILEAENVFTGSPEQQLEEIYRRLGPFAEELFKFQDEMERNGAIR
jgi:hypothetical protein